MEDSAGNRYEEFAMIGGERIRLTYVGHADWATGPTIRIQKRMESGHLAPGPEFPARFAGDLAKALIGLISDLPSPTVKATSPGQVQYSDDLASADVNPQLYERLTEAAKRRGLIAYGELEPLLGLNMDNPNDRARIGQLLGGISRHEVRNGRPMLSSVVWHKDMSGPGRGFYNLGTELGRVRGGEDELVFATRELNATYAEWERK
jgi:hypothetical protein